MAIKRERGAGEGVTPGSAVSELKVGKVNRDFFFSVFISDLEV